MDRSNVLTLISRVYTPDSIGQRRYTETGYDVFCDVRSISQSEFFAAGQAGMKPAYQVTMFAYDYAGQEECLLDGVRYSIYRTYRRRDDDIELYLERRVGS